MQRIIEKCVNIPIIQESFINLLKSTIKTEATTKGVLCKKLCLEVSQNSQENKVFFNKVAGL